MSLQSARLRTNLPLSRVYRKSPWIASPRAVVPAYRRMASTIDSRTDQKFTLPDQRVLGFAEFGSQHGYPLMYFHGFPMSRLEGWGLDRVAKSLGIRVIAPDRPGFGLSTFQTDRTILDWPVDVQALADHLALTQFAVLGASGGGPYALACAKVLPQTMMSGVGIAAGAPPWEAGEYNMPWYARATSLAARYAPTAFRVVSDGLVWLTRSVVETQWTSRKIEEILAKSQREDDETSLEDRRKRMVRILFEGFTPGAAGFVQEARLLSQDWGIRYEDVFYDEVRIWHGSKDVNAPVVMLRYMADRLPHCTLNVFEGDTHWTSFSHMQEVLTELVPERKDSE